jgi:hypothetical protein
MLCAHRESSSTHYYVNITANSFDMAENYSIAPSTSHKPWIHIVKSDGSGHEMVKISSLA